MAAKHGLGRGLEALIRDGTDTADEPTPTGQVLTAPTKSVKKGALQPRREFDADAMTELTESVRERGVLQPLLVRKKGSGYELIAGERRLRAATEVGLADVPIIVMDGSDSDALEVALVENLQRQDLNVLEEAEGYQTLSDKFNLTQEDIAARVGKARATIANAMRLLSLPAEVKAMIADRRLSAGHAKILTGIDIPAEQQHYADLAVRDNLSVRNLEKVIERNRRAPRKPRTVRHDMPVDHITYLSGKLHQHFGTSVRVTPSRTYANGKKGKGTIEIDFYSNEDLDRILELLGVDTE